MSPRAADAVRLMSASDQLTSGRFHQRAAYIKNHGIRIVSTERDVIYSQRNHTKLSLLFFIETMRAWVILACAVAAAAAPTEGTGPCGGAESIAEFDLYGKGWFHANTGCGADDTNGTVLEHFVACESDVLYPPFPTDGNGPEKCQSLGRKDGGSFIATKVKHGCWGK